MKINFRFGFSILSIILFSPVIYSQSVEQDDYRKISSNRDQENKSEDLKNFIVQYPSGKYLGRAYNDLFNLFVNKNQDSAALYYADRYLNTLPEAGRMNAYNSVAFRLAEKKMGLDSAAVYAQKAVDLARNGSTRALRQILDTQALVYFERGYADSALALEREAIKGNETDPSYLYYLAIYEEATGNGDDAFTHIAQAILFGDRGSASAKFDEWLKKTTQNENEQRKIKASIVKKVVDAYIDDKDKKALTRKRSAAAVFMANMGVDLQRAETMAASAVSSIDDNTPLDMMIAFKTNLATIHAVLGKHTKALEGLLPVRELVSPYQSDYWYTLGQLYEKQNDPWNAMESYIQGLVAFENPKIKSAVDILMKMNSIDEKELSDRIALAKEKMIKFEPGKSTRKNTTGRAVLAELFTGAECGPCVASDNAFDKLSEYYTRNDLVILEYHVHIPGPDPMTNPDSYKRYQYYGGDFGTPTVFIDGGEKMIGGGGSFVASNRFRVYDHLVVKNQKRKPGVTIQGSAEIENDIVKVALKITSTKATPKSPLTIHVALVEKSIAYTGANGVNRHIYVVRDLVNGAEGDPLTLKKKEVKYTAAIDVNEVRKGISSYLDDPTKDPSWRGTFTGWKERTDTIDLSNLAVVAWVQDNITKEVFQSFFIDVTKNISLK